MKTTFFLLFLLALNGLKAQKPLQEQAWDLYHKEDMSFKKSTASNFIAGFPQGKHRGLK